MAKGGKKKTGRQKKQNRPAPPTMQVDSLLDAIQDGNEYGSIVSVTTRPNDNLLDEVVRGLIDIESTRERPCILYTGNVVKPGEGPSGVETSDDLPFSEMVQTVPSEHRKVDVFLATFGGNAHQISRFVNCLRSRFDEVDFIIPSFCMSAGTIFALSGDNIWMTNRACLGPIDPQVPIKDGRYVPAQALLLLIKALKEEGDEALKKGKNVPWTAVRLIDTIDKKELGDAMSASNYSILMAKQFLIDYKFKHWETREGTGEPVTQEYKEARAQEIAEALASHDRWKSHGHAISRDVLWNEIKLKIAHPDHEFQRKIYRLWALCTWLFDKLPIVKMIISKEYKYCSHQNVAVRRKLG